METLGCTKCGGKIHGRSVIKFAIIDASSEEGGKREEASPRRGLILIALTAALYYLCAAEADGWARVESRLPGVSPERLQWVVR